MLVRIVALVLVAVASLVGVSSAKAQNSLGLIDPAKLTWGTSGTFPPFEMLDKGKPVGFDIDLIAAMVEKMHVQSAPVIIDFKGLIPALLGGRLDAINSGVYINPERSAVIDLIPYFRSGDYMVVVKGNPQHLTGTADLCGHKLAAAVGTVYEKQAHELQADCKAKGKPELTVLSPPATPASVLALREGRVDATVVAVPVAIALMQESPGVFETVGEPFNTNTLFGIGVNKSKPALKAALEAALKEVAADGTYAKLIKKYGLPASSSVF